MGRIFLLVTAFFITGLFNGAASQILLNENFQYPPGDSLTAHGWTLISSYENTIIVATGSLTYSGYINSGVGFDVRLHNSGQDVYRQHSSVNNNFIYASFMVNVDSAQPSGDFFFAMLPDNSTSVVTMRTYIKSEGAGYKLGISKGPEAATYTTNTYFFGITYLVVAKYTFNTGTNQDDQLSLFVLSGAIPGSEPAPNAGPITGAQTDPANIGRIVLRQGDETDAPSLDIDGFRVYRVWGNLTGITPISTIAESFSLSQNYPNPFNPSTKINFSIPERGFVTLKIYDLLGKEIRELVKGEYSGGVYAVDFSAGDLSSGIYIYSIEVNSESGKISRDTKKLTLLK
jgi:hypothetical protein